MCDRRRCRCFLYAHGDGVGGVCLLMVGEKGGVWVCVCGCVGWTGMDGTIAQGQGLRSRRTDEGSVQWVEVSKQKQRRERKE